jgi:excisionase family DNA binding protein
MNDLINLNNTDTTEMSRLMTIDEARDKLRISRWSIYRLINDRQLKTITIGSRRLIAPQDLDEFMQRLRT